MILIIGGLISGLFGAPSPKKYSGAYKKALALKVPAQYTIDSELYKLSKEPARLQMSALRGLAQVAKRGFTAEDLANLRSQMAELQATERGAREASLTQMASRGMLGSGAELAARLAGQQATQQAAAQRGLGLASQAQQRALQAMQALPTLGATVRSDDLKLAMAMDAIQQFNKEAARRQFQDELAKLQVASGAAQLPAQLQQQQAATTAGLIGNIASAGILAAALSDRSKKEDIKRADKEVEKTLDKIQAYEYRYKEPEIDGEGYQLGVMAQDIEKTPIADAVFETGRGKMVDLERSRLFELAALSNLHKRIRKLEEGKNDRS